MVKRYENQYSQPAWRRSPLDVDAAEGLWPQLIGDFYQTLRECDLFLSRHGYLRNGGNNASSNLRWWLSAEGDYSNLTARLKFHITRVEFYTQPREFDSIIRNGSEIQQLRRQVANLERLMINGPKQTDSLWADIVPEELRARIKSEFQRNSPSWFKEGSDWPFNEAFKALAFHFAAGTVGFSPSQGSVPELLQYLNLAKAIWLLEEIKTNHHFQAIVNESIWADRMRQLEDDLRGQIHRFEAGELEKPAIQMLLELPNSYYSISSDDKNDPDPLDAGEAGPLEEKILDIRLLSDATDRESALLVFRENEIDFRLVTSTKQADTLGARYDKDIEVNMDRHRLVPAYRNPFQGTSPRYNLLLYNDRGRKPKEFVFEKSEDIMKLQRALTGYRVHHDMPVARWSINDSKKAGESGKGMLQLWQFKPLPPMPATSPSKFSDANSSTGRPGSPGLSLCSPKPPSATSAAASGQNGDPSDFFGWNRSPLMAEMMNMQLSDEGHRFTGFSDTTRHGSLGSPLDGRPSSQRTSVVAKSNKSSQELRRFSSAVSGSTLVSQNSVISPVRGSQSNGVKFQKPELPVLVVMTLCGGRYSFLHLTCKMQCSSRDFQTRSLILR